MAQERQALRKLQEFPDHLLHGRSILYHLISDPCQLCNLLCNGPSGINKRYKTPLYLSVYDL